jgi:O-antigen ligase
LIIGSRQVSQWLNTGTSLSAQRLQEGSPVDQAVYGMLIISGLCVLARRHTRVGEIVRNNVFLILFILYEGISFVWSDFPGVAFKRWLKALGDPVMVLVLLTDASPTRAIASTISRAAYILIPLSVLFCKYYENLGRTFDGWGHSGYTGVALDKNMLGYLLFSFGLFFVASLMATLGQPLAERSRLRTERIINILFLLMIVWLLSIANSSTASVALTAGTAIMIALRSRSIRKHFWFYALGVVLLAVIFDMSFSLQSTVAEAAGRDASFTGRTGLWETVLREPINPIIGTGYSTFWLGERVLRFWQMYPNSPPIQAHNGYLEVYVNLGLIGLFLLACVLFSGLRMIRRSTEWSPGTPETDRIVSMFAMPFGIAYLFYNITEAAFGGTNFLFVIFLMLACRAPAELSRAASTVSLTRTPWFVHRDKRRASDESRSGPYQLQRARIEGRSKTQRMVRTARQKSSADPVGPPSRTSNVD